MNEDEKYVLDILEESIPEFSEMMEAESQEGLKRYLVRVESAVKLLEDLHRGYYKKLDLLHDRSGVVAAYIIFARVIQCSYSILHLLEARMFADGSSLLRTVYEAHNLALYFTQCPSAKKYDHHLTAWFDGKVIGDSDARKALKQGQIGWDQELRRFFEIDEEDPKAFFDELNAQYSKMTHITYPSIMATDNYVEVTEFVEPHTLKFGFDYRSLRRTVPLIPLLHGLCVLTWCSAEVFGRCFTSALKLTEEEHACLRIIKETVFPNLAPGRP